MLNGPVEYHPIQCDSLLNRRRVPTESGGTRRSWLRIPPLPGRDPILRRPPRRGARSAACGAAGGAQRRPKAGRAQRAAPRRGGKGNAPRKQEKRVATFAKVSQNASRDAGGARDARDAVSRGASVPRAGTRRSVVGLINFIRNRVLEVHNFSCASRPHPHVSRTPQTLTRSRCTLCTSPHAVLLLN